MAKKLQDVRTWSVWGHEAWKRPSSRAILIYFEFRSKALTHNCHLHGTSLAQQIICDKNIVSSYSEKIRVSFSSFLYFSRRGRAPSRLQVKKLKSLLKKTRKVRLFVWKRILKNTLLPSKIHCYVENRNGLYLNRYRSNCKSVRCSLRASPKWVRKQGKVYLSSNHKKEAIYRWGEVWK